VIWNIELPSSRLIGENEEWIANHELVKGWRRHSMWATEWLLDVRAVHEMGLWSPRFANSSSLKVLHFAE
jgi:hypothetical protein